MQNQDICGAQSPLAGYLARRTLALVLAGGAGARLKELTEWHAKFST